MQPAIRSSTFNCGDQITETRKTDQTLRRAKTQGATGRVSFVIKDVSNHLRFFLRNVRNVPGKISGYI